MGLEVIAFRYSTIAYHVCLHVKSSDQTEIRTRHETQADSGSLGPGVASPSQAVHDAKGATATSWAFRSPADVGSQARSFDYPCWPIYSSTRVSCAADL